MSIYMRYGEDKELFLRLTAGVNAAAPCGSSRWPPSSCSRPRRSSATGTGWGWRRARGDESCASGAAVAGLSRRSQIRECPGSSTSIRQLFISDPQVLSETAAWRRFQVCAHLHNIGIFWGGHTTNPPSFFIYTNGLKAKKKVFCHTSFMLQLSLFNQVMLGKSYITATELLNSLDSSDRHNCERG